ncbi:signal transduction histidine kinase [Streptomyces sp. SAI-208]|jgi:signal transduction histidine kinase|uniref:sensor histidine kinase n=1 Tax=unclassified Streptomyces TaxID=2593676 RepID=UPI0024740470|nr:MULTISPECIES: sensor histidine kinase [unclassified Streptomyces]MDH6517708.1 signal transduction histidine kinase [Streptomyces sp. SAI-090]MDH6549931.1 signal transduction histidine kinase [Streptomyces sp. SAI-041]MDH6568983.1 signal transduction histidine kinase [Streptomyces sp. SAI-117]MDH6586063.1 signal transduction histidine kinase [Streptomyces sp. SAI-133]MDH6608568.1 signal transduction histidine kinase [Streptomyces sp. SAI-208]
MTSSPERRYTHRLEEFSARHPFLVDLSLVLALMGSASLGASLTLPGAAPPDDDRLAVVLMGVSCLALLLHRTHPRLTVVVNALCATIVIAQGYLLTPLLLGPVMASLYWLATLTDRTTLRTYGLPTMLVLTLAAAFSDSMDHVSLLLRTIGPVFWLLFPLAAGTMTRLRRAYLQATQARADHAERTREEEARLRVTEERMRIARELHDVVAHHLALANAQAGTAEHLALANPRQTQQILHDLTGTTSSALRELKATLGLLRQTDDEGAPLEPAPGLARLPELVSSCASAGITVTVTTEGEPQPLSPGVDLTAFRIVQEALTNVTKHAATQTAHVRFVYDGSRLLITVTDEGPPTAAPGPVVPPKGFGVMGMRERAHSIGGELRAGPRPEGGFEVRTALPLQPSVSSGEETA